MVISKSVLLDTIYYNFLTYTEQEKHSFSFKLISVQYFLRCFPCFTVATCLVVI